MHQITHSAPLTGTAGEAQRRLRHSSMLSLCAICRRARLCHPGATEGQRLSSSPSMRRPCCFGGWLSRSPRRAVWLQSIKTGQKKVPAAKQSEFSTAGSFGISSVKYNKRARFSIGNSNKNRLPHVRTVIDVVRSADSGPERVPMRWGLIRGWWKNSPRTQHSPNCHSR